MQSLDESKNLTRTALEQLLAAEPPATLEIDGRHVSLTCDRTSDELHVAAAWDGGRVAFRLRIMQGMVERGRAEDKGHKLGLQAFADRGKRELIWISFEWPMRDAIRTGGNDAPLHGANSYIRRKDDVAAERDITPYGPRSREIAARCGLGASPSVLLGTWSIGAQEWEPASADVLSRTIVLAIIKAHFIDRGVGVTVENAPLFALGGPQSSATVHPKNDRLAGVPRMPGPARDQVAAVVRVLEQVQQEEFTPKSLRAALGDGTGSERWVDSVVRMLGNTGLIQERDGRMVLGERGASLLETHDPLLLFDALRSSYTGFDEALAFFGANPGKPVRDLRPYLNAVLGTDWENTAQPRVRAYWLTACGLLGLVHGRFTLTDQGRAALEASGGVPAVPSLASDVEDELADPVTSGALVQLDPTQVDTSDLVLPPGLIERCCAALASGKHLLLIGPPGTGKSTIAERLADAATAAGACEDPLTATASADWTTYDTIGGWTQRADQTLAFREGVVTRSLRERRWLVLDEVNRADIDKCFGELFTVLAGGTATTAYTREEGGTDVPVEIGPDATPYTFGPWFRLLATMNVRDKASLFRLSYAFLRRFAVVVVPALDDTALAELASRACGELALSKAVRDLALRTLSQKEGLGQFAPLGPSLLLDILRYAKARDSSPECAIAEAVGMVVVPQLEGIGDAAARKADALLGELFGADEPALTALRAQVRSNFPHLNFDV